MDRATAEKVDFIMREVSGRLNESLKAVQDAGDENEFRAYRQLVGKLMGAIYLDIQMPIYTEHPDLIPPELRPKTPGSP